MKLWKGLFFVFMLCLTVYLSRLTILHDKQEQKQDNFKCLRVYDKNGDLLETYAGDISIETFREDLVIFTLNVDKYVVSDCTVIVSDI